MQLLSNKPKDIYFDLLNCFRMTLLRLRFIGYCFDWCFDPVITNTWQSKQQPKIGANLVLWLRVCFKRDNYKILIGVFCSRKVRAYWLHAYDVGGGGGGQFAVALKLHWIQSLFHHHCLFIATWREETKIFLPRHPATFHRLKMRGGTSTILCPASPPSSHETFA